ncbi:MAG: hypothetical protein K9G64_07965 [Bacteroidia bacterium]|nr:hypothetical protein [Bacteroidia bacterium]
MNINLFSINSLQNNLLNDTFNELKKLKGQFEFILNTEYKTDGEFHHFITNDELFGICNDFRKANKINKNDICILISPLTNFEEYFSLYDNKSKNIFVCTESFEEISTAETPYLIAHQVVENILQCVSNFNPLYAHENSIGCINDFCEEKQDLLLKLRTADICPTCIKKFIDGGLTNATLFQSMKFLEELRSNFLLQDSYNKQLKPLLLKCVKNKKKFLEIYIGDQLISFTKTEIFLYYLLCIGKDKGVDFNEEVYEKADLDGIEKVLINKITNNKIKSFVNFESVKIKQYFGYLNSNIVAKYINIINNKLNEVLGANLACFYIIKKRQSDEKKEKLAKELEEINKQREQILSDKLLDKKDKAIKIKEIDTLINDTTKKIELKRAKDFPYVIELFNREDYKEFFKLDIK